MGHRFKYSGILLVTILFFLLINTIHLWDDNLGVFAFFSFLFLVIYFFVLVILWGVQFLKALNEHFKQRKRILVLTFLAFVLITAYFYPNGLINFEALESESLFVAQREGAANCRTTLKLNEDYTFSERNVCFGVTTITGKYRLIGDTLFFEDVSLGRDENNYFEYAVIINKEQKGKYLGDLVRFKNAADTMGHPLWITKNELKR